MIESVGAKVSILTDGVVPAPPALPAASVYAPAATVMFAEPEARFVVGVKTAVLVSPEPLIAPSAPPLTTTSPVVPFQVKELPGSSLNVNVMFAEIGRAHV